MMFRQQKHWRGLCHYPDGFLLFYSGADLDYLFGRQTDFGDISFLNVPKKSEKVWYLGLLHLKWAFTYVGVMF